MSVLLILTFAMLGAAAVLCVTRILRGISYPDRAVALDVLLVIVVCGIVVDAARTRDPEFLNVAVVAALLGFTGTALISRFIERRGAR